MIRFEILILLLGTILFLGCDTNCEKINFIPSEIQWFDIYKEGQIMVFKSNLGRYDTLKINSKQIDYTDCNRLERGKYQYNVAAIRFSSKILGRLSHYKFEKNEKDKPCSKCFRVGDLVECYEDLISDLPLGQVYMNSMKDSVESYNFDKSNAQSVDVHLVESFNWNPKYGLIRYTINNNEVFELVK